MSLGNISTLYQNNRNALTERIPAYKNLNSSTNTSRNLRISLKDSFKSIFPESVLNTSRNPSQKSSTNTKSCFYDVETLFDENLALKIKLDKLKNERQVLLQRVVQADDYSGVKTEQQKQKILYIVKPKNSLMEKRKKLKILKEKLEEKDEKLQKLKLHTKNWKSIDTENQIKAKVLECLRLKDKLEVVLSMQRIQNQSYLLDTYNFNTNLIEKLKISNFDYFKALEITNNELKQFKGSLTNLVGSLNQKKIIKLKKKQKIKKLKKKLLGLKKIYFKQQEEFHSKEKALVADVSAQKNLLEEKELIMLSLLEKSNKKKELIENFQKLNSRHNMIMRANTVKELGTEILNKFPNPPKFFKKIHEILLNKNMMIEVFLSLIDKNNNSHITIDEIYQKFGQQFKIKIKHINHAIKIIGCNEKYIPLVLIQEWYYKYDYSCKEKSSSSDNTNDEIDSHKGSN
jgi:hypothetical protein